MSIILFNLYYIKLQYFLQIKYQSKYKIYCIEMNTVKINLLDFIFFLITTVLLQFFITVKRITA
ncbi:hypothetical protein SAMN04488130_10392 [Flavobacterium urumqiense]|uniref:Uncharacterized protein n=1 Tax=Flavobacterium urumqiense TaxID=935224 RepID=A0A1H5V8H0_9FLAO|nr:hypothetical protein SAMN04488130_10392 [Flavobacterium urumqiense]